MYLTNNQRLDLNLVGQSDVAAATIQTALGKAPTGYYVQDVKAAAPARTGGSGGGAGGGTP